MIYTKIKGGLGNQLFQYSVAYYLHNKTGASICLDYSSDKAVKLLKLSGIKKNYSFRNVQLECFTLNKHEIKSSIACFIIDRLVGKIIKGKGFTGKKIAPVLRDDKDCREISREILDIEDGLQDIILSGYWQNINYIEPIRADLISQFELSIPTGDQYQDILNRINSCESVGVHIRRGDFVSLGWEKSKDYYLNCINKAREDTPKAKFFLFSDDQKYVKENIFDSRDCVQVIMEGNHSDVLEFSLLRSCKHQIISESTFGWWAAYLNNNPNKKVFIPDECRGDIWLPEWIRVVE